MKHSMIAVLAVAAMLLATGGAMAGVTTIEFKPNDLLNLYSADPNGSKTTDPNARRLHETWATEWYNTFSDYMDSGHTQPSDYNTYLNWRASLGAGEGLNSFSTWLHGDPAARSWGEVLLADPSVAMTATVSAGSGWNCTIVANPWDTGYGAGYIAVYWTTDPNQYIRPSGPNLGTFSFTADLYVDADQNNNIVGDANAQDGVPYRIWFADTTTNQGDPNVRALVFDNAGWGSLTPNYGTFSSATAGDSALEAVLVIPEPATMSLLVLGGLAMLPRRGSRPLC